MTTDILTEGMRRVDPKELYEKSVTKPGASSDPASNPGVQWRHNEQVGYFQFLLEGKRLIPLNNPPEARQRFREWLRDAMLAKKAGGEKAQLARRSPDYFKMGMRKARLKQAFLRYVPDLSREQMRVCLVTYNARVDDMRSNKKVMRQVLIELGHPVLCRECKRPYVQHKT